MGTKTDRRALTARQIEIAKLVAQGNKSITVAALLGISEQVVKNQLTRIYDRLNIRSRVELTRYVMEQEQLNVSPEPRV